MPVIPTQTDYELIQMKTRNTRIKIEVLNFNFQTVNLLEGRLIDGSITVDATADIRRTCNITILVKNNKNLLKPGGELWIDKFIKIYQGVDNPRDNNSTVWWNMGIFLINNPNSVYNSTTSTISFEGLDLMAKITDRRNGQLPAVATVVPAESNLAEVVKQTITQLGGFKKYIIEDEGLVVPYEIKMETGATVYDLLVKLRDLYSNWEMFFDTEGVFYWRKIPSGENEATVINFNQLNQPLIISDNVSLDYENVKNNIIIYGRLLDNGHQVFAQLKDTLIDSPFNVSKIGDITYVVTDEQIYNDDLARQRANYELFLHARMNDAIVLEVVSIPWLNDVNVKIEYTNNEIGIEGDYLIKSLEIPLGIGSTMVINAIKIYPELPTVVKAQKEYPITGEWYTSNQTQFPFYTI